MHSSATPKLGEWSSWTLLCASVTPKLVSESSSWTLLCTVYASVTPKLGMLQTLPCYAQFTHL